MAKTLGMDYTAIVILLAVAVISSKLCKAMKVPTVVGMLIGGAIIGAVKGFDGTFLGDKYATKEIKNLAFQIVLVRAGLSISMKKLKDGGLKVIRMGIIPLLCEAAGEFIIGFYYLDFTGLEAAMLAFVCASLSPALVIPSMDTFSKQNRGPEPSVVLAGAPLEVVFATSLFGVFSNLYAATNEQSGSKPAPLGYTLGMIPVLIILAVLFGATFGVIAALIRGMRRNHQRRMELGKGTKRDKFMHRIGLGERQEEDLLIVIACVLACNSLCLAFGKRIKTAGGYPVGAPSYELAILTLAFTISYLAGNDRKARTQAKVDTQDPTGIGALSAQFNALWYFGEMFLFLLIGSGLDLGDVSSGGGTVILVLFVGTIFRAFGVFLATLGTDLSYKGRLFCYIATIPKATVQASIGGVPLSLGVSHGAYIQTAGVLAVAIFAPIGVTIIGLTVDRLVGKINSSLIDNDDEKVDIVEVAEARITSIRTSMTGAVLRGVSHARPAHHDEQEMRTVEATSATIKEGTGDFEDGDGGGGDNDIVIQIEPKPATSTVSPIGEDVEHDRDSGEGEKRP